ncbi:hypothetical protein D3C80_1810960 [compost metagenome]
MAQSAGFRTAWPGRGMRKTKEFNSVLTVQRQIGFPGIAFFAVKLAQQREPENVTVKTFAGLIIRTDDGDVMDLAEI